jgi:hypothetical protein
MKLGSVQTLLTHPVNFQLLRAELGRLMGPSDDLDMFSGFRVRPCASMAADRHTGFYLVDGRPTDPAFLRIQTRFIEYGPEDIPYLLYAGIIAEEREPLFYLMSDPGVDARFEFGPRAMHHWQCAETIFKKLAPITPIV